MAAAAVIQRAQVIGGLEERDGLLQAEPRKFFITPHYSGYPAVLVRLGQMDLEEMTELAQPVVSSLDGRAPGRHDGRVASTIGGLVERFYGELWNRWNDAAVEDTLSPEFTFRGSLGLQTSGLDGWRQYRDLVRAGSADFHNQIIELVCDGQRAAARLRYSGTHTGLLLGLPATQRRFEYAGAAFFAADSQRLTSAWILGDLAALRRQLS